MNRLAMRTGKYVRQPGGYDAFVPAPLPLLPLVILDDTVRTRVMSAVGALSALSETVAKSEHASLMLPMFIRAEAQSSSEIEGINSSIIAMLTLSQRQQFDQAAADATGCAEAVTYGLRRMIFFPLSLRLIRELHKEMLGEKNHDTITPGEFRTSQNWIGVRGSTLQTASYVPPAPADMTPALENLEKYIHENVEVLPIIATAVVHAQFEAIHPFLDGNGRIGRILGMLMLVESGFESAPYLCLSRNIILHQQEYYRAIQAVHIAGNWEDWTSFFAVRIAEAGFASAALLDRVERNVTDDLQRIRAWTTETETDSVNTMNLYNAMLATPVVTVTDAERLLGNKKRHTALSAIEGLARCGILSPLSGEGWANKRYIELFEKNGFTSTAI